MSLELLALASTTHIACSSLHATASTRSQRERLSVTRAATHATKDGRPFAETYCDENTIGLSIIFRFQSFFDSC